MAILKSIAAIAACAATVVDAAAVKTRNYPTLVDSVNNNFPCPRVLR